MLYPSSLHAKSISFSLLLLSFDILDVHTMAFDEFHPSLTSLNMHNSECTIRPYKQEDHLLHVDILHTFHLIFPTASSLLQGKYHCYFGLITLVLKSNLHILKAVT